LFHFIILYIRCKSKPFISMKKIFTQLTLLLLLASGGTLTAQPFQKGIDFSGDDYANVVVSVGNSYYIVGSTTAGGGSDYDAYIAKLDSAGNPLWEKQYGGSGTEYGTFLMHTNDNNLLLLGRSNSYGSNYDIFAVKTDLSGNVLWAKTFGTDTTDFGFRATEGPMGYLLVGQTIGAPTAQNFHLDILAVMVDAGGNLQWSKTIGTPYANEVAYDAVATGSDGFAIAGYTGANLIGLNDGLLAVIDSVGGWRAGFISGGIGDDDYRSIVGGNGNNLYLVGNTHPGGGNNAEYMVVKYDVGGQIPVFKWVKAYGGAQNESLSSAQAVPDGSGDILLFGHTNSFGTGGDALVVQIDSAGTAVMGRHFGGAGDDYISSAAFSNSGALLVGNNAVGGAESNVYLVAPDQTGNTPCNSGSAAVTTTAMPDTSIGPFPTDFGANSVTLNAASQNITPTSSTGVISDPCFTGIKNVANQLEFNIYPNPATSNTELVFYSDKATNASVSICNYLGETVNQLNREVFTGRNSITLNVSGYAAGMYFVKVKTEQSEGVMPLSVH
jgi:hypothetical protein